MADGNGSNSGVIAVVVLAVIVIAAFVAFRAGVFSGKEDSDGINIDLPGGSSAPSGY